MYCGMLHFKLFAIVSVVEKNRYNRKENNSKEKSVPLFNEECGEAIHIYINVKAATY